jgi:hypothetical protein
MANAKFKRQLSNKLLLDFWVGVDDEFSQIKTQALDLATPFNFSRDPQRGRAPQVGNRWCTVFEII